MGPTAVTARGFGWQHHGRDRAALRDVSFHVEAGERILLAGPSGAGKSTLLAALAGVLGGDDEGTQTGQIELRADGHVEPPGRDIPVGLVLQDPDSQITAARVGDDVAFGCENLGVSRAEIWPRVRSALDMVGLPVPLDHPTAELSGGQKQRLALAGVIAMGAGLILLDEPTANLDPRGVAEVVAAVERGVAHTGATLIVVEHNVDAWQEVTDRALVLDDGHVESTTPRHLVGERAARLEEALGAVGAARPVGPEAKPALACHQLRCAFGGPSRTVEIPAEASTVITGANGSGKSTWLLTMAGLLKPKGGGTIEMSSRVARGLKPKPHTWASKDLAQRIGFVFQNPEHQFVARTVEEELQVAPTVMGIEVPEDRIAMLAERLRLDELLSANPFTLSGGEKRRLSVATALVAAPQVLLLDEPTFGQDPETFTELVRLLRGLVDEGITIASITHDELFIRALADHHVDFGEGKADEC